MRSNHAGETGAVWIYFGAGLAFWSAEIRAMALQHGATERQHLLVMEHLVPTSQRSHLIFLWKVMGLGLGLLSAAFGYKAFCLTIRAVETFVEDHYREQIQYLKKENANPKLLRLLERCCEEEVDHQLDAHDRVDGVELGFIGRLWSSIVSGGSGLAVKAAKKF
ncbi:demethoxyubiquinone hydroxylase family protein [Candidatus Pelagadaptatus aseana]|uniref:demethoxyubiquinone hydroxylase family protein n=1 Tax=Candidatus Pelagadaptatus aseana TaxID=3120508 RepID=UPI003C6F4FB2